MEELSISRFSNRGIKPPLPPTLKKYVGGVGMAKVKVEKETTKVVRKFRKEKATKNTIRYTEVPEKGEPEVIRTIYIQKWLIGDETEAPEEITITLEF